MLYGTGITIGAGIYVLIGAVAGHAGVYAPWSFLLAAAVMGFTVASYIELSTRYPVSAGEAAYVRAAFQSRLKPSNPAQHKRQRVLAVGDSKPTFCDRAASAVSVLVAEFSRAHQSAFGGPHLYRRPIDDGPELVP